MKFVLENIKVNHLNLMRRLGYHPHKRNQSFARRLSSNEFPRFHVYLKEKPSGLEFSLHLDQKGACYEGHTAHSGDYDTEVLDQEKQRIISLINT
ncbi:hypothetical protein HOB10_00345 [Candidatus Parcubacteria bacterium]|jgi:hypothetical protein|nr:hypothetical protein [Candidatus Parcubacteria bacterium]